MLHLYQSMERSLQSASNGSQIQGDAKLFVVCLPGNVISLKISPLPTHFFHDANASNRFPSFLDTQTHFSSPAHFLSFVVRDFVHELKPINAALNMGNSWGMATFGLLTPLTRNESQYHYEV
ncbi:hypothetical protein DITRI_Ditri10aG0139400 [Diplodiscus trichospermus]